MRGRGRRRGLSTRETRRGENAVPSYGGGRDKAGEDRIPGSGRQACDVVCDRPPPAPAPGTVRVGVGACLGFSCCYNKSTKQGGVGR